MKIAIQTPKAPAAIGTYSHAIKVGNHVYISGQIPLNPETMLLVEGDIEAEIRQMLDNLGAIITEAGGHFSDVVKLTVYLTDLIHYSQVNAIMMTYFKPPYPARTLVQVSALPKGARVEIDAIMILQR
jgi:reactive intermediate/imine deaminase